MSWVKVDDHAPEHRKQAQAGAVACWLWVCGLAYANRQPAHDGFIPSGVLPVLYHITGVSKYAARLVVVGLWERVDGGYQIHDYHEYQLTRDQLNEMSARKSAAGKAGGIRSGESRRSKAEADAKHGASENEAEPQAEPKQTRSRNEADPDPVPENIRGSRGLSGPRSPAPPRRGSEEESGNLKDCPTDSREFESETVRRAAPRGSFDPPDYVLAKAASNGAPRKQ